ncbi:MAG: hypothetical protein LBL39_02970 [Planctomycetaceae bacterium]|jgi:hypothetical protein|nr:hypothetical protein [Planctomycetaceae bacterium]
MISVSLNYDLPDSVVLSGVTAGVRLELFKRGVPVISGGWQCLIHYNGKQLRQISDWKERNAQDENENENGCELIEIESELDGGFRLRRFFLLDTLNRNFIACDSILGNSSVAKGRGEGLRYESTFIYSDKLQSSPSGRDGKSDIIFRPSPQIRGSRKPAPFRVIPLAYSAVEFLRASGGKISLCQNCNSSSMFVPLFFDFKLSRIGKETIWRELTIGENLEKVPQDKATGYRIQTDKDQFLLYYSLIEPANRTLLGHNLIDEICYAKFEPKSGVNPLLTQ